MESPELVEGDGILDSYVSVSAPTAFVPMANGETASENLGFSMLDDLDSYWEDINDRLIVSRLVTESVIKGMVTAVEQEAADRIAAVKQEAADGIAAKELELTNLKAFVRFQNLDIDEIRSMNYDGSIQSLKSDSELSKVGGVSQGNESENWNDVNTTLDERQWEKDIQDKLKTMVLRSSIQTSVEDFEQRVWSENAWYLDSQRVHLKEKFSRISDIRIELDAILKSFPHTETGQLASQGSNDTDHFHRKSLSSSITSLSLWNENGKLEGSRTDIPETYEAASFSHLDREGLVGHFNNIITQMRRDHESTVQQLTEEFFSLKREYLKERGSSSAHKKDKEFDALRKRISEVVLKLDDFLTENENPPSSGVDARDLNSFKNRLDSLLSENHRLRDSVMAKKEEVKFLTNQLAISAEEKLQHSLIEANMVKTIEGLNSDLVVAHVENALVHDVYKCTLTDVIRCVKCDKEESDLKMSLMQDIYDVILSGTALNADIDSESGVEDSDMEQLIVQETFEIIFREALKDAEENMKQLYGEYLVETENRKAVEMNLLEIENKLASEVEDKERLKQEIAEFLKTLEEKEKSVIDLSSKLTNERKRLEIVSEELNKSRKKSSEQEILVCQITEELEEVKGQLKESLLQIDEDRVNIKKLNEELNQTLQDLKDANEQRKMAVALSQEKQTRFLLFESKENELRKQMETVVSEFQGMFSGFESKVAGKIQAINSRFENSVSQLSPLFKKAKLLKKSGRMYQQRLERKSADLQMAEAEVDLLGDEVDKLLSLLEKIYISLDHYSPVLQHYPGVVEILKLIRRELTGESMKTKQFSPC
ncbi:OLC1v1024221C1 [Oldenlandia corymbosa var. corymbosa]|uniref:OLC1v1024221C1 n=1 Tax=Oldenlandia corymbosa var. corymbosa TaxID=529605 RepID=A0AAV1C2B1_OLDCO|nr:OLC1v1024221C1 [Oldenlandia corymbosa var. corymbosa]